MKYKYKATFSNVLCAVCHNKGNCTKQFEAADYDAAEEIATTMANNIGENSEVVQLEEVQPKCEVCQDTHKIENEDGYEKPCICVDTEPTEE